MKKTSIFEIVGVVWIKRFVTGCCSSCGAAAWRREETLPVIKVIIVICVKSMKLLWRTFSSIIIPFFHPHGAVSACWSSGGVHLFLSRPHSPLGSSCRHDSDTQPTLMPAAFISPYLFIDLCICESPFPNLCFHLFQRCSSALSFLCLPCFSHFHTTNIKNSSLVL